MNRANELYKTARENYHKPFVEALERSWIAVLGKYTNEELRKAWEWWRGNTTIGDGLNLPLGARMPQPAELKTYIEEERDLARKKQQGVFIPCRTNGCVEGFLNVTHGKTYKGNPLDYEVEIDKQTGEKKTIQTRAVVRCECWWVWLCGKLSCSRQELAHVLKEREKERKAGKR